MVVNTCPVYPKMTFHKCLLACFDRPNITVQRIPNPGAAGAYAAGVTRVRNTLEPLVGRPHDSGVLSLNMARARLSGTASQSICGPRSFADNWRRRFEHFPHAYSSMRTE